MSFVDHVLGRRLATTCACGHNTWRFDLLAPARLRFRDSRYDWRFAGAQFLWTTFRITCAACEVIDWEQGDEEGCPRCHRSGGRAPALRRTTQLEVAGACRCGSTDLAADVHVPVHITSERQQVGEPVVRGALGSAGFHVHNVACAACEAIVYANPNRCICND